MTTTFRLLANTFEQQQTHIGSDVLVQKLIPGARGCRIAGTCWCLGAGQYCFCLPLDIAHYQSSREHFREMEKYQNHTATPEITWFQSPTLDAFKNCPFPIPSKKLIISVELTEAHSDCDGE